MSINLVTSFNVKAWDLYAKDFLTSFDEKWDDQIQLAVYYDGGNLPEDIVDSPRISYFKLEKDKDWKEFHHSYGQNNGKSEEQKETETEWPPKNFVQDETYNYRMDATRFSHKVFAITGEARRIIHIVHGAVVRAGGNPLHADIGHLAWIDSDSKTKQEVSLEDATDMICKGDNIAVLLLLLLI
jgi:hypothetical protein